MKRREFMALLGGAAAGWPLAARAQRTKVYRIGALLLGNADADAFRTTMREELFKSANWLMRRSAFVREQLLLNS